jgi:hypothetical protein
MSDDERRSIMAVRAQPAGVAPPCFDRDYWLAHCDGFRVETADGGLGFVDHVEVDEEDGVVLAVRAGLLGRRVLLVAAGEIDFIVPRAEKIWLRSPARIIGMRPSEGAR